SGYQSWEWARSRTWCTGTGYTNDPYIIKDLKINGQLNGSCIYIYNSNDWNQNFRIENSIIYNSSAKQSSNPAGGIHLVNVMNGTIINNKIYNNDGHGIILSARSGPDETTNILIQNNNIENNNGTGIYLNGSYVHDNLVYNNTVISSGMHGICIFDNAYENIIANNSLYDNEDVGIYIKNFQPQWPVWPDFTWDKNYVYNNTITLGDTGIGIEASFEIIIHGNKVSQTDSNGIAIGDFNSRNITIQCNEIYSNLQYGINFGWESPSHTTSNIIEDNKIYNNIEAGITMQLCFGSNFSKNIIYENNVGISLAYSNEFNTFFDNHISNNEEHGLAIFDLSCKNNKIYGNNFTANGMNGFDFGLNNEWYFMNTGNYWDDYGGNDSNDDMVGDSPYDNIGGDLQNPKDYFSKWWDAPRMVNIHPLDDDEFPAEQAPEYEVRITEGIGQFFWYEIYEMPSMSLQGTSPCMALNGNPGELRTGKILQSLWSPLGAGDYVIRFAVNDSRGFVGEQIVPIVKLNATTSQLSPIDNGSSGGDSTSEESTTEEEGLPWYIQAAMTGAVSASVGLVIKQSYSSAKKRRIILEKIHENFARVENLEKFLRDKLEYEDWKKLEEPWKRYQAAEISERELIKTGKKTLGKRFTGLFIPHKRSRMRT
ncbi:MAG: hypothetical protein EU549_00790, partial [Promethearchaeota archaeon]